MVKRGEVDWGNLDPTLGTEIRKTRPVLTIPPDDMNAILPRVIVAPITSKGQALGCRPIYTLKNRPLRILLDQTCSIDEYVRLTFGSPTDKVCCNPLLGFILQP